MSDDNFYRHDRPSHPGMHEDRPRGGAGGRVSHGGTWSAIGVVVAVLVLVAVGIALFP